MSILTFVNSIFEKRRHLKEYGELVNASLSDGILSDSEKQKLSEMQSRFGLTDDDVRSSHRAGASRALKQISSDRRITEDEKSALNAILEHFKIEPKDISFDQKSFNKFYTLALLDNGIMPTVSREHHDLNMVFKEGEVMHFGQAAVLRKFRRVTTRVNYGGLSASIKIAKGLRYRVGSMGVSSQSTEVLSPEDTGGLYFTSERVVFAGHRKRFEIPYAKVSAFELKPEGLFIFKTGKETPYILTMDDYEVPLAIVSHIMNE